MLIAALGRIFFYGHYWYYFHGCKGILACAHGVIMPPFVLPLHFPTHPSFRSPFTNFFRNPLLSVQAFLFYERWLRSTSSHFFPSISCFPFNCAQGMQCMESAFKLLNSCALLKENFSCEKCSESYGPDQPCYVELTAPTLNVRVWPKIIMLSSYGFFVQRILSFAWIKSNIPLCQAAALESRVPHSGDTALLKLLAIPPTKC